MHVEPMYIIAAGSRCSGSSRTMRSDTAHDVDRACVHCGGSMCPVHNCTALSNKWRRSIDLYVHVGVVSASTRERCIALQQQQQQ